MDWPVAAGAVDYMLHEVDVRLRRRRQRRIRAAAGGTFALLIAVFAGYAVFERKAPADVARASSAVVTRPERQVLADGSVVELKDGAEIALNYTEAFRRVTLVRGEAHFQVAKNPQRPFVVLAGGVEVCAVGTAFSVQRGETAVEVLVTEGRVAVEQVPPPPPSPTAPMVGAIAPQASSLPSQPLALVDAGSRLVVGVSSEATPAAPAPVPLVRAVSEKELSERLAWRMPRLEFSATPLPEVIAMMNQHGRMQLVLSDSGLRNVHLSGLLRADDIDTLLRLLEEEHGIKAVRRGDSEFVLSRAR